MERITQSRMDVATYPMVEEVSYEHEQHGTKHLHMLNDQCLSEIFSFLPISDRIRSERVCKRWQAVIQDSWRTVKKMDLSYRQWHLPMKNDKQQYVNYKILKQVFIRCGRYLKSIDLFSYCHPLEVSSLCMIGRYCPNIKTLNLMTFPMLPQILFGISRKCHNLTRLSLGECRKASERSLSRLFRVNQQLKHLTFNKSSNVTGRCLTNLPADTMEHIALRYCRNMQPYWLNLALEKFVNLNSLSLLWCTNIDEATLKIIGKLTKITRLTLYPDSLAPLKPVSMHHLINLVNLEYLEILHRSLVTDNLLLDISLHCKKLKVLDIHDCAAVTNRGVIAIIENLPNLLVLCLTGTSVSKMVLQAADQITASRKTEELLIFYARNSKFETRLWPKSRYLRIEYEQYL